MKNHADFDFLLHNDLIDREIEFSGKLEHISELIFGNTGHPFHADINVHSPKLVTSELMSLFPKRETPKQNLIALKKTILGMLHTFDPTLHLQVDTFIYEDVKVTNLETGIHLKDSTTIVLDKTGFDFHKGSLDLNAQVTLNETTPMPFEVALHTNNFDLGGLLKELHYLDIALLKDMKQLNGVLTMNLDFKGAFSADGKQLLEEANQGDFFSI